MTTVLEIWNTFHPQGLVTECTGDKSVKVLGIAPVDDCGPGDLVFVDKKEYVPLIEARKPSVVVTSASMAAHFLSVDRLVLLISSNVSLAHAFIKQKYGPRRFGDSGWEKVHSSAVVHGTVQIGLNTVIEPRVVIGQNSKVGANCRIMAGVVIENDVVIGERTIIHPAAVIGYRCQIGSDVIIGSGSVIGSEGFGFAQDDKRKSHSIPQTGIVIIEDRVRVGANNCIDRAAYQVTRIGAGTKLDNLCHIAHNVQIGQDCLLTAMLCVAGSTKIGDRVITSGQTGILDHVSVCSDSILLHRAGVCKDLEKPGAYAGLPLQALPEYMKNMAVFKNLLDLKKRLSELEKKYETGASAQDP